jgi:hypothetical protein
MDNDSKKAANSYNQATRIWTVLLATTAETLKGYYNEHQATKTCDCSLCKRAERTFRKLEMKP